MTRMLAMTRNLVFIILFLTSFPLLAQDSQRSITVNYTSDILQMDGIMDEAAWETADESEEFWQFFPTDSTDAEFPTEMKILYNESTLYIGIRAGVEAGNYVVSSLRRDFSGSSNDNITLMFDTFSNGSNAYMFGVTPYGVQRDVLISGGGSGGEGMNDAWDATWLAETQRYEDHYVVEIAIPFSSLKFPEGTRRWRFQTYRWDLQSNEQSAWNRVPQNQLLINLAFMGELIFEEPLGDSSTPVAIIPYVNTLSEKDFTVGEASNSFDAGGDAKIAIGQSMNLDLTINPDFSDVEVDDIITNLTRFEVSRPERRQFFLDNSDLFSSFGSQFGDAIPFFSRRIGIARNESGALIENRILGGARLSGNLNEDWRLGLLNIQTAEDVSNAIPGNNNMMFSLQRRVFSRSSVGAFFVNRQTFGDYDFLNPEDEYNRVFGADFNLASADNVWTGTFYLHSSVDSEDHSFSPSAQAAFTYNTRNYEFTNDLTFVDQNFRSDLGFIPRKDMLRWGKRGQRNFWPEGGIFNRHSITFLLVDIWQPTLDYKPTDHRYSASWDVELSDQSSIELEFLNNYIYLTNPFDPTRSDRAPLPGEEGYTFNDVTVSYESNQSRLFTFDVESTVGQFFNGNRFSIGGQANVRWQPWASFSIAMNYDRIRLPEPHSDADLWLLSPRMDITFSRSVFWSTLVQYSNQQNNLGLNSRLQWRFAPLSDLYLVYNDNYISNNLSPTYRSINLKVSYWFNL